MSKRVALITGANRGLGRATAEALARRGYAVIASARDRAKAEATVHELQAELGPETEVHGETLDVTDDAQVAALFDRIDARFGRIDVLVNNAGVILEGHGDVQTIPAQTLLDALDINTVGPYRTIQAALPRMNAAGYGRIVNVSSGMGALTDMGSGWPAYRISKTALHAVTVQGHLAAGPGVKVNVVCPGWVRTDMGGLSATRSVAEGIRGIVWAATLPDDGPSGGFFRDGEPVAW